MPHNPPRPQKSCIRGLSLPFRAYDVLIVATYPLGRVTMSPLHPSLEKAYAAPLISLIGVN